MKFLWAICIFLILLLSYFLEVTYNFIINNKEIEMKLNNDILDNPKNSKKDDIKDYMEIIYKILSIQEWQDFQKNGYFKGSKMDEKDGFIHASFKDQYPAIMDKFFANIRPLVLVKINTKLLEANCLKIEANKPGGNKYPHIYEAIPLESVISYEVIN